mmetsp:Transcript_157635/g.287160  ORF Transcript_157635/g.287160 Transcript_157635/m.287160 type:complete len:321 (+) Transcript_157635:86-1048(+)
MAQMALLQFLLLATLQAGAQAKTHGVRGQRIAPELDHESHKKFVGDYKTDKQPGVNKNHAFQHPYPAVQEQHKFHDDYIKDSNGDGGKFENQMAYDVLRNKARKEEKELKVLKERVEEEDAELKDAIKKEDKAAEEAEEAQKALNEAKKKAEATAKDGSKTGGAIGEATEEVEKEIADVENCKKELEEAKDKLKKLMEAKEDRQSKLSKAQMELEEATETKQKAETEEAARKENEKRSEEKLAQEKAEHEKALATYEQELEDVKQTEKDLQRAAEKLKKQQGKDVGPNGAVTQSKSGAFTAAPGLYASLAVLATLGACRM